MAHIPYGYRIVNGRAELCPEEVSILREFIRSYLSGYSIKEASRRSGLPLSVPAAGNLLRNPVYTGDGYYPALISRKMQDTIAAERQKRYEALGCFTSDNSIPPAPVQERFFVQKEWPESETASDTELSILSRRPAAGTGITAPAGEPLSGPARKAALLYELIRPASDGERRISDRDRKWLRQQAARLLHTDPHARPDVPPPSQSHS